MARATFSPSRKAATPRKTLDVAAADPETGGIAAGDVPAPPGKKMSEMGDLSAMSASLYGKKAPDDAGEERVLVNVPQAFNLTDDNHKVHSYGVGQQRMRVSHANHFYAKANGVTEVEDD